MISRRRRGLSRVLKPVLFVIPVALVFSIIWLRSSFVALEYELGHLQILRAELIKEQRELIARKASMASMKKIERIAVSKMGFVYPDRRRVFFVKSGSPPMPRTTGLEGRDRFEK